MTEAATQSSTPVEPSFEPLQGMRSLRVLARLLDYPTQELQDACGELIKILNAERRLGAALKSSLMEWCQRLQEGDLLDCRPSMSPCSTRGALPRCCYLSTFTANPVIVVRPWWI